MDAAEKLIHALRERVSPPFLQRDAGDLTIVVPDYAKSAATLMCLGADRVVMTDSSELGPIDPQVSIRTNGSEIWYAVADYLQAHEDARALCIKHPDNPALAAVLLKLGGVSVESLRMIEQRTRQVAQRLSRERGFNPTEVTEQLMDRRVQFPSHGQMITWYMARELGMAHVEYVPDEDPTWGMYWDLYRRLRQAIGTEETIVESRKSSLIV